MTKCYLSNTSILKGNIDIKDNVNIWYNAVLRAENNNISIDENTNIQDNCIIHADENPVKIGKNVTIGHGAIIHGCSIDDDSLIGMGAVILDNVKIGKGCLIGANTLISENKVVEDYSLVYGNPGKVISKLSEDDIKKTRLNALKYVNEAKDYLNEEII